ncbi:hypothetical protein K8I28_11515 [bacterium]|nr:hypothetical protein [bacterium]
MLDPQHHSGVEAASLGRLTHILRREQIAGQRDEYSAEQQLKVNIEVAGYEIFLTGRIDGMWREADVTVIEEVKTVFSDRERSPYPSHRMQCAIYVWMHHRITGDNTIGCLTQIYAIDGRAVEHEIQPELSILESEIRLRIEAIITYLEAEELRLRKRAESAEQIKWLFSEYRPGQEEIIHAVSTTIASEHNLVLEATPGSGKTAPVLIAALKKCCISHDLLAFATSRSAQQDAKVKLLQQLAPSDSRGRSLLLSAVDKICPYHKNECVNKPHKTAPLDPWSPPDWLGNLLSQNSVITSAHIQMVAKEQDICAALLQREIAKRCDILIGDHNLLADPDYRPGGWFSTLPGARKTVLLLDEAHGLPDRLRERRSAAISLKKIRYLVEIYKNQSDPVSNELSALLIELYKRFKIILSPVNAESDVSQFEKFEVVHRDLREIITRLVEIGNNFELDGTDNDAIEFLENLRMVDLARQTPNAFVAWMNRQDSSLHWTLVEPGQLLQKRWQSTRSTIAFSATLSPWSISQAELGFKSDITRFLQLPYPFPEEQRLILRFTGINTGFKKRMASLPPLAKLLAELPETSSGDWIVFFPSYDYLRMCMPFLQQLKVSLNYDHVGSVTSTIPYSSSLEEKHTLHLHVLGGKSSEGVEWNELNLTGVVIISPGIPPISPERELMQLQWDESTGEGFFRAYLYPALIKTIQASGRLIRDENKVGVILLVGERFGNESWESIFPEEWQQSEIYSKTETLIERITSWWQFTNF